MDESERIIQRLWRRATALTGDQRAAEWVVAAALGAADSPLKMHESRRDRLVAQRAREASKRGIGAGEGAGLALSGAAAQLWEGARALPRLQMEAWTLRVLEGMEEIPAARALDCSRSAMNAALEQAEETLRRLAGEEYVAGVEGVRRALAGLDAGQATSAIRNRTAAARRRRRVVSAIQLLMFFACAAVLTWVGYDLLRSDRTRDLPNPEAEQYSAPMPKPAQGVNAP